MIGWIVTTLAASSALMLLVLVLRRPVAQHFGPRAAYALWLLPALRMVLPPLPEAVNPVVPVLPAGLDLDALLAVAPADPGTVAATTAVGIDWALALFVVWLVVALIRFVLPWLAYRRFMVGALAGGRPLGERSGVAVHLSGRLAGPLAAGVFARRIVLPHDFHRRFDSEEQRLAIAHEAAHHARGDTIANAVALAVLALHWWNPIAHVAWRAFRADQELACDALVLRNATAEERHAYGSALLKAAFGGTPAVACGMACAAELKRRLRTMTANRRSALRTTAGSWLAGALVLGGLIGTATGGAAAEQVRAFGERAGEVMPVPPAPPPPMIPSKPSRVIVYGQDYVPAAKAHAAPDAPLVMIDGKPYIKIPTPPAPAMPPLPPAARLSPLPSEPPLPPLPPAPATEARVGAMQARAQAMMGRAEAARIAAEARAEIDTLDIPRLVATSLGAARTELAAACAEHGIRLKADERDWGTLATCDRRDIDSQVREALRDARRQIADAKRDIADADRARITAILDREIARLDARR